MSASSSSAGVPSTTPRWVGRFSLLLLRGLTFVWQTLVSGIFVSFISNLAAMPADTPFPKLLLVSLILTYPIYTGLIFVALLALTILAQKGSQAHGAPPAGTKSPWLLKWAHRVLIVIIMTTAGTFLFIPPSLSPFTLILIAIGILACIALFILFFIQIRSGKQTSSPKTRPDDPFSTPLTRRSFFSLLSVNLGAALGLGYFGAQLQAVWSLLHPTTIVTVVYSTEKEAWLRNATDTFNQQVSSKGIQVVLVDERGSLEAANKIVAGMSKPTVWSPASTAELHYLSTKWQLPEQMKKHPRTPDIIDYTSTFKPPSLVHSPLVFAVWQSRATALSNAGYNVLDWSDLRDLLSNSKKESWSAIGEDTGWGAIKFGQTQPDLSNSGLLTLALISYAFFGEQSGLTAGNIKDAAKNGFQAFFQGLEDHVWCFGPSSGTFIDTVIQRGPAEFDIITTYENLVLTKEAEATQQHEPLVMYYPPTLNILSDHPFAILRGDWVTSQQEDAAKQFRDFLLDEKQQQGALAYGFRSSFSSRFSESTRFSDSPLRTSSRCTPKSVSSLRAETLFRKKLFHKLLR